MEYKAVLFDLDGTLIDTVDDIGDAANRVLSNRNVPRWSAMGVSLFKRIKGKWGACHY